jgi:hypothetical protein
MNDWPPAYNEQINMRPASQAAAAAGAAAAVNDAQQYLVL